MMVFVLAGSWMMQEKSAGSFEVEFSPLPITFDWNKDEIPVDGTFHGSKFPLMLSNMQVRGHHTSGCGGVVIPSLYGPCRLCWRWRRAWSQGGSRRASLPTDQQHSTTPSRTSQRSHPRRPSLGPHLFPAKPHTLVVTPPPPALRIAWGMRCVSTRKCGHCKSRVKGSWISLNRSGQCDWLWVWSPVGMAPSPSLC